MSDIDPEHNRRLDRRTFLKGGVVAGGLLAGAGLTIRATADTDTSSSSASGTQMASPAGAITAPSSQTQPNILVIVVDQMRYPQWFSPDPRTLGFAPNLQRLREGGVSFARHYTVANDCTPARSAVVTGLYTHQTGCMITGGSTLDPGFPTWGTLLAELGYDTRWYGKWHLTHGDNRWTDISGPGGLAPYGFAGGTFPSPDGAPGQGWRVDPHITRQFERWFVENGNRGPWCTTVSFVNPHDIAWWYAWSDRVRAESSAPPAVGRMVANFETPEELIARRKPRLQRSLQETAAKSFGPVPFHGRDAHAKWLAFADLYMKLQSFVDLQIGKVMETLESNPEVAANTVIVFTSDHGEYGGSHGLRGKGAAAYEEAIRVPLLVKDPRGELTAATEEVRNQLTSHVDVAPMLLSIATGSQDWRKDSHYGHLAERLDMTAILGNPEAPGREHVLHATDEVVTEFAVEPYAADAPLHVVALRTARAKYATYSRWPETGIEPLAEGQETELYDYSTHSGRLEIHNSAGENVIEASLAAKHAEAITSELHAPLPGELAEAHARGFADYFSTAKRAATRAAERRRIRSERTIGRQRSGDTGGEDNVQPPAGTLGQRGGEIGAPRGLGGGDLGGPGLGTGGAGGAGGAGRTGGTGG
jgi:arylsulfatase A-like enzyme